MIAVFGAGPHGQAIAHELRKSVKVTLYDDNLPGYPNIDECTDGALYLAGAAWPEVRRQIAGRARVAAWHDGTVLFPGVRLSHDAMLGEHVHVLHNAVVSHGCQVGAFTTICASAVLAGDVTVGESVVIGANATVIHGGITIGNSAKIGAGTVVLDHVPAGATVVGAAPRIVGGRPR